MRLSVDLTRVYSNDTLDCWTQFYLWSCRVYQLLGEAGTYYGVRFGKNLPWVTEFPFGYIKDPQYVGSILSLFACLCWVPLGYIFLWVLGYLLMMRVEASEDPATRANPFHWFANPNPVRQVLVGKFERCLSHHFFQFPFLRERTLFDWLIFIKHNLSPLLDVEISSG